MDFQILETAADRSWDHRHLADHRDVFGVSQEPKRSPAGVAA